MRLSGFNIGETFSLNVPVEIFRGTVAGKKMGLVGGAALSLKKGNYLPAPAGLVNSYKKRFNFFY